MRGESLRRGAEGSYETGVPCLYLSLDDTPSLPAGSHPWGGSAGRSGAAAEGRDRPVALALLLLPSLCAMNQLQPRGQSCVEGVSLASVLLVCWPLAARRTLALFPSQSRGSRSSAATDSCPERRRQQQPWKPRVGVSPAMPPSQRVREDGSVSCCLPEGLCSQRAACVYRGSQLTPDLWCFPHGRKALVVIWKRH